MWTYTRLAALAPALLLVAAACAPESPEATVPEAAAESTPATSATRSAEYETWVGALRTLGEAWDTGEVSRLDKIMAANVTRTAPDQTAASLDEYKAFLQQVHVAYPDFRLSTDAVAAGPDGGFLMWTVTGTNTGEGPQAPTGNSIDITGISFYRFANGKIASERVVFDSADLLRQLESDEMPHVE